MVFYFLQLFIFTLYSVFFALFNNKKWYFGVTWLHLSCVMGLRSYLVGTDTKMYVRGYLYDSNTKQNSAILYEFLNKVIRYIAGDNYHIFLFTLSAISIGTFLFVVFKWSNDFLSMFTSIYIYITFYYYFNSFNMQRQMLAVTISMMATYFWVLNNRKKSIICFLFAIGIHNTAILSLINIIVNKFKAKYSNIYKTLIVCLLLVPISGKLINLFSELFPHYEMYNNEFSNVEYGTNGGTAILGLLLLLFIIVTPLVNTDFLDDHVNVVLMYLTCIGSYMYILGFGSQLIIRLADYFTIYCTIFLPKSIETISLKFKEQKLVQYFLLFMILVIGLILMYYKLSKNMGEIIPYQI